MCLLDQAAGPDSLGLRYHLSHVFRPMTDRQAWERELREELPVLLADHQQDLAETHAENRERREQLEWQIRRVQKLMADIQARLAGT